MAEIFYHDTLTVSPGSLRIFSHEILENGDIYVPSVLLSPEFQWRVQGAKQQNPALQWITAKQNQQNPSLQWNLRPAPKFYPNIISFPFYWELPVIQLSKVSLNLSGCLFGYSVHLKDTGNSGTTTIEIYLNNVLKDTLNISSDGGEYNKNLPFDLTDLLTPDDKLEVKVISVADGSEDLKVTLYEMTFDYSLKEMDYQNISNDIVFSGKNRRTLFESADFWSIEFNQPMSQIESIEGIDHNGDSVSLTAVIENGTFVNNRIKITPHLTTTIETIKIKLKDLNEEEHLFELTPEIKEVYSDYQKYYRLTSSEIESFLPISGYRYSFDGGNSWSDWGLPSNENKITLDFTGKSQASYSILFQYQNGAYTIEESKSIYYAPDDINTDVTFKGSQAFVEYTDLIPLDKIQVYYDDVLADEVSIPVIDGMENVTTDSANHQFTISTGSLYYNNQKYDFDGSAYTVQPDTGNLRPYYQVLFGFNKITLQFEYREVKPKNISDLSDELFPNFILIWAVGYFATFKSQFDEELHYILYHVSFSLIKFLFEEKAVIALNLDVTKNILIKIIDIAGRYLDFTYEHISEFYNLWRTLVVTGDSSDEVFPGQIHQNINLNYTINTDDWS